MGSEAISPLRPASTVVLMRDAPGGPEVFLVRRHDNIAFMGGAHVFPGGRVDDSDRHVPISAPPGSGIDRSVARMPGLAPAAAAALHVAAARELFEEAGVLLTRRSDGRMLRIGRNDSMRFDDYRRSMVDGETTLAAVLQQEELSLALDALSPIAHWVTPPIETRRFDTWFFLALAPDGQAAAHVHGETTEGIWIRPADAIADGRRGAIALPPPTWTTLRAISKFATAAEAWAWAGQCPIPRIEPGFVARDDGSRIVTLPGDPGYPPVAGFEAEETRFVLKDGRWEPG